jgi:myo-inositol-1(or 4)-monophosphatase
MALEPAALLDDVSALARAAGSMLRRHHAAPVEVAARKSTRSDVVTAADTAVEAFLVAELLHRFPDHHLVGEEGGGRGAPAATAEHHWHVDPLDGTVNFAAGLPHFCTSIALTTRDREPLLGVVYDPVRDELFAAVRGGGARLNGRPLRVSATAELADAVVSTGFPYDKHLKDDNNLREWGAFLRHIRGERRLGSAALDLAWVAAGRLDGYWEQDLNPWDALAGILLVREAGGTVTDYADGPVPQRLDRGRYVASNGRIHAAMLEVLSAVRPG